MLTCLFVCVYRDFSPALFNSVPILPGSSVTQLSSDSNTSLSLRVTHDPPAPSQTKPMQEAAQSKSIADSKDGFVLQTWCSKEWVPNLLWHGFGFLLDVICLISCFSHRLSSSPNALKSPLLLTAASKIEPMKALDSRFTERSKVTPGVSCSPAAVNTAPVDR